MPLAPDRFAIVRFAKADDVMGLDACGVSVDGHLLAAAHKVVVVATTVARR